MDHKSVRLKCNSSYAVINKWWCVEMFRDRNSGNGFTGPRFLSAHSPSLPEIPFQHKVTGMAAGSRDMLRVRPPSPPTSSSLSSFPTCCLVQTRVNAYVCCICWRQPVQSQIQTEDISENEYSRVRYRASMIFTWRFPHNSSHYLPLYIVAVETLMARDEFYIQMLFHLKIFFLLP